MPTTRRLTLDARLFMTALTSVMIVVTACAEDDPGSDRGRGPHYTNAEYADPSDELYDPASLPRYDIDLTEAAFDELLYEPREYVPATFTYRGEVLFEVGIRLKGEMSFRDIDEKPSFKLKFDKFVGSQRFRGLERMTLNNNMQDPSFLSQTLAYELYRAAGVPAPRANSALVYVNGEYYGVYSNVETEDSTFVGRWFADAGGNLYEEGGLDFLPGNEDVFDLETNEDEDDRSDLTRLIDAVDRSTREDFIAVVGAYLDMDAFLSFCAVEVHVGGEDSYAYGIGSRNNFRVYSDPGSGKFYFLPWGVDRGLRPRFTPLLLHDWVEPAQFFQSPWEIYGVLLQKCVESPQCKAMYVQRLSEIADLFENMRLQDRMKTLFSLIEPDVLMDERKEESNEYVPYALETMQQYISGRPASIRDAIR